MRDINDLERNALKFWPEKIALQERHSSIIPRLIETQEKFISILNIADADPFSWKNILLTSQTIPPNLFLKHLIVLSDIGGEMLMRFKNELPNVFKNNSMIFVWNDSEFIYNFHTLNERKKWNNANLKVNGKSIFTNSELSPIMEDVCNLLLFGGLSKSENIPQDLIEKCNIGLMLGKKDELSKFVKQRYIWVSRITGGATANMLGQLAQNYVENYLKNELPDWKINEDFLSNVSQNDRTILSVDIVAKSPQGNFCAIEVSFQVTTNSTIERKAGQAQTRQELLHKHNHKIAYVIDGAGNFERQSALYSISQFSDCTVSFKESELKKLVNFLLNLDK